MYIWKGCEGVPMELVYLCLIAYALYQYNDAHEKYIIHAQLNEQDTCWDSP